ncbi:MAG TPA: MBL fold metallo-hydrolase [Gammaproteobacteria bacterium]|nr:MBL fold metallo-hydrolase [Gammaproteobacteria bacterium]
MRVVLAISLSMFSLAAMADISSMYHESFSGKPGLNNSVLSDGKLHLYLCGTGVPQVTMQAVRKPACLAAIADEQFMLFDAGDGAVQTLGEMSLPFHQIQRVFLTHLHSDHMSGLGEIMNGSWHSGRTNPITVYGPYGTAAMMDGWRAAYQADILYRSIGGNGVLQPSLALGNPVEISATNEAKRVYQGKNLTVSVFKVDHQPVFPAFGYIIEYKNCKIVVSGDTKVDASLANNSKNADVLISEAVSHPLYESVENQLKAEKANEATIAFANQIFNYHADSWALAEMAEASQVKQLVLTHLLPAIPTDEASLNSFKEGMATYYNKPITVANDRDEIIIQSDGKNPCQVSYVRSPPESVPVLKVR